MNARGVKSVAVFLGFVAVVIATAFAAEPASKEPRLSEVEKFPAEYQEAVRAVIAAADKEKINPGAYFAEISLKDSVLSIWLKHPSHDDGLKWRGDSCGKCRMVSYDLRTRTVSRFFGIR